MSKSIKDDLKDVYNRYARIRDTAERPSWKDIERRYALDAFLKNGSTKLLEIGAGTCQDSIYFKEHGLDVTAIDFSEEHVKCCKEKNIKAIVMDVYDMDFQPDSFDAVYSMNCFLHIPKKDLPDVLKGVNRILSKAGLFYLGVYGDRDFEGKLRWTDYNAEERFFAFYMFEDFKRILESIFRVIDARVINIKEDLIFHGFLLSYLGI
jgi:SAM-dependent methyltransferase